MTHLPATAMAPPPRPIDYPDSDGEPMADNTEQFAFIQTFQANLDLLLPDFVAGDHLWYPVEGRPDIRVAPDVYVALGRPKGHRGSYKQWVEGGVPLQVVFEWWSPRNDFASQIRKLRFYEQHGVQEFYTFDQLRGVFSAFVRRGEGLDPVDTEEGFQSPLLGVRFQAVDGVLRAWNPDGSPFRTVAEMDADRRRAEEERARAEEERAQAEDERDAALARTRALEAQLRALGVTPD